MLSFCLFVLFSCGESSAVKVENPKAVEVDTVTNVYVPQNEITPDCGLSPYLLMADQMFTDSSQWYKCKVRFVKIVREKEPEVIDVARINKAIDRLNQDYLGTRITFEASEVVVIEDKKAYREGIKLYRDHGSKYSERGFLNVFIYPSTLGDFSGAAGGIPSSYFAVKEFYLPTSTTSHEAGHCFGLFHTHTTDSSNKKNSYEYGDLICDTPSANFFASANLGFLGRVTDDCRYVGPDTGLSEEENIALINNIQSYSVSECRKVFTKDQVRRIYFIINHAQDIKECFVLTEKPDYA